jgi:parallel beta-helix repeat protein
LESSDEESVTGNEIQDCGIGVDAASGMGLTLQGNRIIGATVTGARVIGVNSLACVVERNVVGKGKGAGITIDYSDIPVVRGNTVFSNASTAVQVSRTTVGPTTVENNIGFGNGGWGASVPMGSLATLRCNDWFANALGAVTGAGADSTDLSVEPMFCNVDSADVRLNSGSPLLADSATCGQIGALGIGCGETATLVQRFMAMRVGDGVRVVWEVADGASASAIWVERAEGLSSQAWIQPVLERSTDGRAVVELDRTALPDRAYRYRLMAQDGGKVTVLDPGIVVEAQARLSFDLAEVGPSPSSGPIRIAFTLAREAAIEIDVFDLLGRQVTTLASGNWLAGAQVVSWDGSTRDGRAAPPGMYVVRYVYPGGQSRRRIMRFR